MCLDLNLQPKLYDKRENVNESRFLTHFYMVWNFATVSIAKLSDCSFYFVFVAVVASTSSIVQIAYMRALYHFLRCNHKPIEQIHSFIHLKLNNHFGKRNNANTMRIGFITGTKCFVVISWMYATPNASLKMGGKHACDFTTYSQLSVGIACEK